MKDYVIRIYRRGKNDPRTFVGAVEEIGVEGNKAFSNPEELWSILNSSKAETGKAKRRSKSLEHRDSDHSRLISFSWRDLE